MNPITSFFQIFIVIDNIVHMFLLMIAHSNIVKVLSETAFLSIVENNDFSVVHIPLMHLHSL